MAAGKWFVFGEALESINNGAIDLDTDSFRMVLVTDSYTPDQGAHDAWSDISSNEVSGGDGYTPNGKALTCSLSRSSRTVTFDCDDQSWSAASEASITAKYAVIVHDADGNGVLGAGDIPLCFCDLNDGGGSVTATSDAVTTSTLSVAIDANGVFEVEALNV